MTKAFCSILANKELKVLVNDRSIGLNNSTFAITFNAPLYVWSDCN